MGIWKQGVAQRVLALCTNSLQHEHLRVMPSASRQMFNTNKNKKPSIKYCDSTNKQANKQKDKQTSKQTNKQTNKLEAVCELAMLPASRRPESLKRLKAGRCCIPALLLDLLLCPATREVQEHWPLSPEQRCECDLGSSRPEQVRQCCFMHLALSPRQGLPT